MINMFVCHVSNRSLYFFFKIRVSGHFCVFSNLGKSYGKVMNFVVVVRHCNVKRDSNSGDRHYWFDFQEFNPQFLSTYHIGSVKTRVILFQSLFYTKLRYHVISSDPI